MLKIQLLRVFILILGLLFSVGAVEFTESRSGASKPPSDTYDVNFGSGLSGRQFNITVNYAVSGNITGTVSAFGITVPIGQSISRTHKGTSGRVVVSAQFADGQAHCWTSFIRITVTPADDGADVVAGADPCGVEIRRSKGTSWIDNLRECHVHDAWDLRSSGLESTGCAPCRGGAGAADDWGLHRLHRYRDMAWRGSFGPGVFHQFDRQLRITGRDAGLVVEYFDPEGGAPLVLRPTGVVGVCEDRRFRQIRSLTFRTGGEQATNSRQEAVWADLELVDGGKLRFEVIPPPADQPEGLGFGRLVRDVKFDEDRQYTITYTVPVRPTIQEDQVINWWGSTYWKIHKITDKRGRELSFTYQQDLGMPVVATASDGAVSVAYSYEASNVNALIGLTGIRYADGTQSNFTVRRENTWWLVTYDDAGASGVHQRNTIAVTGSESVAAISLGSGGQLELPVATYPNRVRRVWNGQGEVVWSGMCSNEGGGRYIAFIQEAGIDKSIVYEQGRAVESRISTDPVATDDPRKKTWITIAKYGTDTSGRVTAKSDALERTRYTKRDPTTGLVNERYTAIGNVETVKTTTQYDSTTWLPTRQDNGLGHVVETVWNSRRQRDSETATAGGESHTNRWFYDAQDRLTQAVDPRGNATDRQYDGAGRLRSVTAPADVAGGVRGSTTYEYTTEGRLLRVTDPMGRSTEMAYDQRGRLITTTYADGTTETADWGVTGNGRNEVIQRKDRNGAITTISYDAAGRRSAEVVKEPNGTTVTTTRSWTYRPGTEQVASETVNGITSTYGVDAQGRVVTRTRAVTGTEFHIETTAYDAVDRPWRVTDPRGRRTWNVYDLENRVVRTVRELVPQGVPTIPEESSQANAVLVALLRATTANPGYSVQDFAYDGEGRRTQETDPAGIATTMAYDGFGRLVSRVVADRLATGSVNQQASRTLFHYDAAGNQTRIVHPRSFTRAADGSFTLGAEYATAMTYTGRNLLASRTDAVGMPDAATVNQTWTLTGKLATVSDPRNATWLTTYGYGICCDRVTTVQDALGFLTQYGYDGVGNRTSVTDPNGLVTTTTYDAVGRIAKRLDGAGKIWLTTYDDDLTDGIGLEAVVTGLATGLNFGPGARGSAVRATDPTGVAQVEVRDGLGRTVRRIDGAGRVMTWTFNIGPDGLESVTATNPLGHTTLAKMDGAGHVRSVTTSAGTATKAYDARGLLTEERDANQVARTLGYDAQGRLLSEVSASGAVTGYAYDTQGNVVARTDGRGKTTLLTYDALNRKATEKDRLLSMTSFGYDRASNLTTITDAEGGITRYTYDARGLLLTETFPGTSGGVRTMTYDAGGRLKTRKDQRAITATMNYDGANRVTTRSYSTGFSDSFTYDDAGRMLTASSSRYGTTVTRSYTAGELVSENQMRDDTTTVTVATGYDGGGRVTSETITGGPAWTYTVDDAGRRTSASLAGTSVYARTFDAGGRLGTTTFANGLVDRRTYSRLQPATMTVGANVSPASVMNLAYAYDANRRKTSEVNAVVSGDQQGFTYDDEDRLTGWTRTPGALGVVPSASDSMTWNLSKVGDWSSTTTNGQAETRTHSSVHEVTSIGGKPLTYDAAGNLTSDTAGQVFVWDEENRLIGGVAVDPDAAAAVAFACSYDALGRRLTRQVGTRRTDYIYQGVRVIREVDRRTTVGSSAAASDGVLPASTAPAPLNSVLAMTGARSVNMQPAAETIPDGWIADKGRALGVRTNGLTYGWQNAGGVATAFTSSKLVVRQMLPQPTWDTHGLPGSGSTGLTWRYQVPTNNTTYAVVVVAGDPSSLQHTNHWVLNGGGLTDPDPYNPSATPGYNAGDFDGWAQTVTVTDGYITISPGAGAVNPALCFVEIGPAGSVVDQALQDRLASRVTAMTNRTSLPAYPPPAPTPRTWVYGGEYVDDAVAFEAGSGVTAKRYFVHNNHLYSPQAVTDVTGAVVERYTYSAYGERLVEGATYGVRSSIGMNRGFTGYQLDEESGLYYARARMYSPTLGRFVSRDPMGYVDGMGLYGGYFVPNSRDPFGTFEIPDGEVGVGVEAYTGVGGSYSVNLSKSTEDCPCSTEKKVTYTGGFVGTVGIGVGGGFNVMKKHIGFTIRGSSYSLAGTIKIYKNCEDKCYTVEFVPLGVGVSLGGSVSAGIGVLDFTASSTVSGNLDPYAKIACNKLTMGARFTWSMEAKYSIGYALGVDRWLPDGFTAGGELSGDTLGDPLGGSDDYDLFSMDL